jgi:UDP-N-acetylmuramate dehydrogenase
MASAGLDVHGDRPLAPLTTYGVGGNGACVVKVSSSEQVIAVSEVLRRHPGVETLVMGRGSNLLIADNGFDGVVVVMSPSSTENAVVVDGDSVEAVLSVQGAAVLNGVSEFQAPLVGQCG